MSLSSAENVIRNIYNKYSDDIKKARDTFSCLADQELTDTQLFKGGRRDYPSEDAITRSYKQRRAQVRDVTLTMIDAMTAEMKAAIPKLFDINADTVSEIQTKLSACASSSDIQRLAALAHGDYSTLSTIAAFNPDAENSYCRTVASELQNFKDAINHCVNGLHDLGRMVADDWRSNYGQDIIPLFDDEISNLGRAYSLMTKEFSGEGDGRSFIEYMRDHANKTVA